MRRRNIPKEASWFQGKTAVSALVGSVLRRNFLPFRNSALSVLSPSVIVYSRLRPTGHRPALVNSLGLGHYASVGVVRIPTGYPQPMRYRVQQIDRTLFLLISYGIAAKELIGFLLLGLPNRLNLNSRFILISPTLHPFSKARDKLRTVT